MKCTLPFLSIVTINRNNASGLKKTLDSIIKQTSNNFEHIIIDGASTDNSTVLIKQYLKTPNYSSNVTFWSSEPDKGIYDAMNKGIAHINGEYCLFLNSGDYFVNNKIIEKLIEFCTNSNADIIYGNAILYSSKREWKKKYPEKIGLSFFANNSLNHQNCLIKTSLQKKYLFNTTYKILSDREFFVKAILNESYITFKYIPFIISKYECENGISSKMKSLLAEENEDFKKKYFGSWLTDEAEYTAYLQNKLFIFEEGYFGIPRLFVLPFLLYHKLKERIIKKD